MAKSAGLEPHLTTMAGYPWETREETDRVIEQVFSGETITGSEWQDRDKEGNKGWRMGNTFPLLAGENIQTFHRAGGGLISLGGLLSPRIVSGAKNWTVCPHNNTKHITISKISKGRRQVTHHP